MLETRITELLGVKYPVMLAGMAGVSYAELVAGVSEAGGYGVLGASGLALDDLSAEIARVRKLTDKPFGVDLLTAMNDNPTEEVERIIDGGATSLVAGLGVPAKVVERCHQAGLLVISMAGRVKHAVMAEQAGCDIVVAQGAEAGGHTGTVGGMALWPQIVDAVRIPVAGAGGIFDGRGLVAALAFGCQGVWIGTRFIATHEARAAETYRQAIVGASESDTVVSKCWTGKTLRALRNATTDDWDRRPQDIKPFPQQAALMQQSRLMGFLDPERADQSPERTCFPAGQGCGGIGSVESCRDVLESIVAQAEEILARGVLQRSEQWSK
jgi:enoyl-[acyl-carrier protein] reductase II